jgi:hypothetical protein
MLIQTTMTIHGCDKIVASACRLNGAAWLNLRLGKSQAEAIQIHMDFDRADVLAEAINSGEKAWLAALEDEAEYLASREANHVQQQWREAAQ